MKQTSSIVAAAIAGLFALPVLAQTGTPPSSPAKGEAKADREKLKTDIEKAKADKAAGNKEAFKEDREKVRAERAEMKKEREARRAHRKDK